MLESIVYQYFDVPEIVYRELIRSDLATISTDWTG